MVSVLIVNKLRISNVYCVLAHVFDSQLLCVYSTFSYT
jgi:hypothetical protein